MGRGQLAEGAAEGELLLVGDLLVAEEQHLPLQERTMDIVDFRRRQRP